ncbi:MAG: hypothetical protein SFV15_00455 [Polyangiaceae bacterium]|nr:hypothetical protein [Polyangiaceae bacterium]
MSTPHVLRVVRPYQTQVEFIAAEAWAIQKDGIIAVGEAELTTGTLVRCEILLSSGLQLIRIEGEVDGYVPPQGSRPGGPKLKIRRVTPSSKEFILTVLRARRASQRPLPGSAPPSLVMNAHETFAESRAPVVPTRAEPKAPASAESAAEKTGTEARKSLSNRPAKVVACPPNRDSLLDQLRTRHRNKANSG